MYMQQIGADHTINNKICKFLYHNVLLLNENALSQAVQWDSCKLHLKFHLPDLAAMFTFVTSNTDHIHRLPTLKHILTVIKPD